MISLKRVPDTLQVIHLITSILKMKRIFCHIILTLCFCAFSNAQTHSVGGVVIDSVTNKAMEYIPVYIEKTSTGCVTNYNGEFFLTDDSGNNVLVVESIGYKPRKVVLKPGKNTGLVIKMQQEFEKLTGAVVKPKRERYRKKNNPAVELIQNVIARKDSNRIESLEYFKSTLHEKLTLSLENYDPKLEKKKNKKKQEKMKFIMEHIDTSEVTGKPILTFSIREKLADFYYRKSPETKKTIQKAVRHVGLDDELDRNGGLSITLDQLFTGVDIFDNEIEFLANRFVSPISSSLATAYYKYYIMDTVKVDNIPCIDLAFVPFNSQSFGFTGRLYITTDGEYSIKKVQMNFPSSSNVNWIDKLRIDQEFQKTDDGLWALKKEDAYVNLTIFTGVQGIFAHHTRSFGNFDTNQEELAGSPAYKMDGPTIVLPGAKVQDNEYWEANRVTALNQRESAIETVSEDIKKNTSITFWTRTLDAIVSEWIPTAKSKEFSKFDVGPILSFVSWDHIEGFRIRAGGMTTANLTDRWFFNGYLAYGFKDKKLKGSFEVTHSFNKKNYHKGEKPLNNLSLSYTYDLYSPETIGEQHDILKSFKSGNAIKYQYIQKIKLNYEKQWLNSLRSNFWLENDTYTPATEFNPDGLPKYGTLLYRLQGSTDNKLIPNLKVTEFGTSLRWAPGEHVFNAVSQRANIDKDTPIFTLTHRIGTAGYGGGEWNFGTTNNSFLYNSTQLEVFKRFHLSIAGFLDAKITAGKVWNQVPYTLLMMPASNQSFSYQRETFHTMCALEFITDQYVQANLTWHMKGLIFNRIPLIKKLKLRELVCFNIAYGGLSDKNNPALHPGRLFELPQGTRPLDPKLPFMEIGVGLENILQIIRVVYYYRIPTYPYPENSDWLTRWGRICLGIYVDF